MQTSQEEGDTQKGGVPARWQEWLDAVHDGGKAKVPNPNPETSDRYKEVSFSTALKNPQVFQKAMKDYQTWVKKKPEEKKPEEKKPEEKKPEDDFSKGVKKLLEEKGISQKQIEDWAAREKKKLDKDLPSEHGKKQVQEQREKEFAKALQDKFKEHGVKPEQVKQWVEKEKRKLLAQRVASRYMGSLSLSSFPKGEEAPI